MDANNFKAPQEVKLINNDGGNNASMNNRAHQNAKKGHNQGSH
jgi:hypothetical protein